MIDKAEVKVLNCIARAKSIKITPCSKYGSFNTITSITRLPEDLSCWSRNLWGKTCGFSPSRDGGKWLL